MLNFKLPSGRRALATVVAAAAICAAPTAQATLALNAVGMADGFTLSTFVDGYSFGGNYGPLAQGILPNGNVITGSVGNGQIYVFKDVDGQHLSDALISTPYVFTTGNPNYAMATAGGQVYGAQLFGGAYEKFDNSGAHVALTGPISGVTSFLGMWGVAAGPSAGHFIAASSSGLIDVDPITGTFRVVNAGLFPDGVSVSPDGLTVYVENGGAVQSYNLATGALIHTFSVGHRPDGTGVISGGRFNGDVIVNNNDGTLGLLDPTKADGDPDQYAIIASGGSRGDFTSTDTNNGTLFISQIESVLRLGCGPGCAIGATVVPEPSALWTVGLGLAVLAGLRRRRA